MELALETAQKLGFEKANQAKAADVFLKLFKLFKEKDATQIEINPLAEVEGGDVLCMDAKLAFDENAEFRQEVSSRSGFVVVVASPRLAANSSLRLVQPGRFLSS